MLSCVTTLIHRSPQIVQHTLDADEHLINAALGQDQLDVTQAQAEDVIQPHGVADDLGRKTMPRIEDGFGSYAVSLVRPSSQRQPWLTWQCRTADSTTLRSADLLRFVSALGFEPIVVRMPQALACNGSRTPRHRRFRHG